MKMIRSFHQKFVFFPGLPFYFILIKLMIRQQKTINGPFQQKINFSDRLPCLDVEINLLALIFREAFHDYLISCNCLFGAVNSTRLLWL